MLATVTDEPLDKLRTLHGSEMTLAHLVDAGIARLPLPGAGRSLSRWRVLAQVAAHDLSLAKLFEGHTDALAILAELNADSGAAGVCWATWCAEPPHARVRIEALHASGRRERVRLHGVKA